jgi:Na+/melibiose symporter-like transporter
MNTNEGAVVVQFGQLSEKRKKEKGQKRPWNAWYPLFPAIFFFVISFFLSSGKSTW